MRWTYDVEEGVARGLGKKDVEGDLGNVRTKGLGSCQEGLPQLDLVQFFLKKRKGWVWIRVSWIDSSPRKFLVRL